MKKIKKFKWLFMLTLILCLVSCVDDLDVETKDPDVFIADDLYSNPESYRQALAGVYGNLALTSALGSDQTNFTGIDAGTSQYGRGLWNMQTLTTDEAFWSWENDPGLADLNRCTWTAGNVIIRGMYSRALGGVAFVNEFLRQTTPELLDSRNVTGSLRDEIVEYRAEARFIRALAYYHIIDMFGKGPFITENDPVGSFKAPEYSRQQLFDFVESELLEIIPVMTDPMQNEYARADKAAAWMLLAKLYLNAEVYTGEQRYTDCLNYCEQIIGSGYSLTPNYLEIFMADNHQGAARDEIIFPILSDGIVTQNYGPTTVMVNSQVGLLENNGEDFGVLAGGWGGALRVPQRFSQTFLNGDYDNDDRNTLITNDRNIEISDPSDRGTGYVIQKWSNFTSTGVAGSGIEIVDTDFPMFRLADVYLMYAEAHLRGGGGLLLTAVDYVNDLRARSNNLNAITSSDLTLDFLLNERLVELHWEGHRRQDLIRFKRFSGGTYNWSWKGNGLSGLAIDGFRDLFPIPSESLAANPNLTQNSGY